MEKRRGFPEKQDKCTNFSIFSGPKPPPRQAVSCFYRTNLKQAPEYSVLLYFRQAIGDSTRGRDAGITIIKKPGQEGESAGIPVHAL
jgi:hypothetical protein